MIRKIALLSLVIIGLSLTACKTPSRLVVDNGQTIDIGAQWTTTDSEIAIQNIYNDLKESIFYHSNIGNQAFPVKIYIQRVSSELEKNNKRNNKELRWQLLNKFNSDEMIIPVKGENKDLANYVFQLKLQLSSVNQEHGYNLYALEMRVLNEQAEEQWKGIEEVKKYF